MIDWSRTYTSNWHVYKVNEDTWADGEELMQVESVSVNTDGTDSTPLLETASITFSAPVNYDFLDGWYRIVLYAKQDGMTERIPISTQLFEGTGDTVDYKVSQVSFSGTSVLTYASNVDIEVGYYIPKGANGPEWVKDQLEKYLTAPVYLLGNGFILEDNIVFSSSTSILAAAWSVLDKKKWVIRLSGDGEVYITERPSEPSLILDNMNVTVLHPSVKRDFSYSQIPNRYIVKYGDRTEVAENHNPNSKISYEQRGRWVDKTDTNPSRVDGESLWTYARRRLQEESTIYKKYTYTREYVPDIRPYDLVRSSADIYGISGDLRVLSQTITCSEGITVQEQAAEEIVEFLA